MRSITILPLVAALALTGVLAGCGRDDKPKSEEEVKDAMANMIKPKPGLYRSTAKLVSFEVPGMPPQQAERLKEVFSQQQGRDFCLTKAEADKGYEEMTKKLAEGNCSFDRFDARGQTIDAKMTCQTGKDTKATIEMKGTMTEEGSQMRMNVSQPAPQLAQGGGSVKMEMEIASQRTGDCPGG